MKISEAPVGTALQDKNGIRFLVADHQSPDYTGTVLVTEKVIRLMSFDQPKEYEDKERKRCGSNDFPTSDLFRWLNGEEGFLKCLSSKLQQALLVSRVPYAGMTASVQPVEARVFIPSITELGLDIPDHVPEGTQLKLFREFRNRYAMPSRELADHRPPQMGMLDADDTWPYWLRSAHPAHGSILYVSHSHSPYMFCEAYRDYIGVRALCAVQDDLEIMIDEKGGQI